MKKQKKKTIRTKFLLMTIPLEVLLITILAYLSWYVVSVQQSSKELYYDTLYSIDDNLVNADRDFYQAYLAETMIYYGDGSNNTTLLKEYNDNMTQLEDRMTTIVNMASGNNELYNQYISSASQNNFSTLITNFNNDLDTFKNYYDPSTKTGNYSSIDPVFQSARNSLDYMQTLLSEYVEEQSNAMLNKTSFSILMTVIVTLVFFATLGIITLKLARYISLNVKKVNASIKLISENDLSVDVKAVNTHDEIGELTQNVATVQQSLRDIINALKHSTSSLNSASSEMKNSTEEANLNMQNIKEANSELATTAYQQANDTEQIAGQMGELNTLMLQSKESTKSLSQTSTDITEVTNHGVQTVAQLTQITTESTAAFQKIFDVITSITKSAEKINEASILISSIAQQTNLLSLNASIEAARAGEAGRGFAVVATEIRQLAEQSAASVSTIDSMLENLQLNTENAVEQSDLVKEYVNRQSISVKDTRDQFDIIVNSIKTVDSEIITLQNVNHNLEEKCTKVVDLVSNLSATSEENASTSEELSATTDTVAKTMEIIKDNGANINNASEDLSAIIEVFKMD